MNHLTESCIIIYSYKQYDQSGETEVIHVEQPAGSAVEVRIKNAFAELMEQQPFSSLRTTSIIQRAGVSHQSFYRCFQNKYDLAIAFFSKQMYTALLFCGKNATVRDVMFTILTIIKNNSKLYANLLRDAEGAKLFPQILASLSSEWTGFEPAWATTVINADIIVNWANSRFATPVEDVYTRFIYSLPAYELLTEEELKTYVERYESFRAKDFLACRHKKVRE